jgi:hypothetical protein
MSALNKTKRLLTQNRIECFPDPNEKPCQERKETQNASRPGWVVSGPLVGNVAMTTVGAIFAVRGISTHLVANQNLVGGTKL